MKKLLLIVAAALFLTACQESKEAKAEKLIKTALNTVIVNIDTYVPIGTSVDSAFAPVQTAENLQRFGKMPLLIAQWGEFNRKAIIAKESMALNEPPFTSMNKEIYNKEYEAAKERLDEIEKIMKAYADEMERASKEKPVFNGYLARHQYRYVSIEGEKKIGDDIFFINKEFTAIEAMVDLADEDMKAFIEACGDNELFNFK